MDYLVITKTAILGILSAALLAVSPMAIAHTDGERHQKNIVPIPLLHASVHGDIEEVNRLIESGADVNAAEKQYGWTALDGAVFYGHAEVVELLVEFGANVNEADKQGMTALHTAAEVGYAEVAELLIAAAANVNATDNEDRTALHWATEYRHVEVIKLLIAAGADVNAKAGVKDILDKGFTALHMAASGEGHAEIVKLLIAAGANVNAKSNNGWTALKLAVQYGNSKVLKVLLDNETNPDIVIKDEKTTWDLIVEFFEEWYDKQ